MSNPQPGGGDEPPRKHQWAAMATSLRRLAGIELAPVGHVERLVSIAGGALAIYALIAIEHTVLGGQGMSLLIASMGATAVLLFAVPHGALSQPWAVIVGHGVSAVIGVACARVIADQMLAASLAVGLAIGAMHYLRAIHPPGGATALAAVIGGPDVHALGYAFVLSPVLVNAVVIVLLAVAINMAFAWRRYPAALAKHKVPPLNANAQRMAHADFIAALRRVGTFMDIDEADFLELEALTSGAAQRRKADAADLRIGAFYASAEGAGWSVRRITGEPDAAARVLVWECVAGLGKGQTGRSTREEFAAWAGHEVEPSGEVWMRRKL